MHRAFLVKACDLDNIWMAQLEVGTHFNPESLHELWLLSLEICSAESGLVQNQTRHIRRTPAMQAGKLHA